MEVMLVLIPVTVLLVAVALWGFVWSVREGQFEDLDKEAFSILFEDSAAGDAASPASEEKQ